MNFVHYQPGVDKLLMEDSRVFQAFRYGFLLKLGHDPEEGVAITRIAICKVDFTSLITDPSPIFHSLSPFSIGEQIAVFQDLERVTFIMGAGDIPCFEHAVPVPKGFSLSRYDRLG
jgi:hypothetical protein